MHKIWKVSEKKNTKKKKRKKKKRKKEKHQGLGLSHLLPAQGLQIHKLWVVSSFPHAQGFAWRANVFSFSFSFFFCYFTLATDFAEREGTPCSLSAPKMFSQTRESWLSRARVWRHGKGSNNTIPSPSSYFQLLVLIPFIMLEGLKGVLRSMVFGQFTVTFFFVQLTVKFAWRLIFSAVLRLTVNPLRSIPMQLWLRLAYCNFLLSVSPNTSRISLKIKKKLLTNHYAYFFSLSQQNS